MNEPPRRLSAEQRREATVRAVVDLAARQNPNDITTAAIAEHMGLTQGALFRHFTSKDAILQSVMSWVSQRLLARVDKAAGAAASPVEALEAMFTAHIDFVAEYPGVPRMLFGQLQRPEETAPKRMVQTLVQHYAQRLQALISRAKLDGELSPELDEEAAAILFIGTIQGLVMQSLLAGNLEAMRRVAPRVFAIYRRGIERVR